MIATNHHQCTWRDSVCRQDRHGEREGAKPFAVFFLCPLASLAVPIDRPAAQTGIQSVAASCRAARRRATVTASPQRLPVR